MKDVVIRSDDSQGSVGLNLSRNMQGPLLIKDLEVDGFDTGILIGSGYSNWLEHITLKAQNVVGVSITGGDVVAIRDLESTNTVVAVKNDKVTSSLSLIDSNLSGGSSSTSAIVNTNNASLFVRNTSSSGYASLINNAGSVVSGNSQSEWVSPAGISLFSGSASTSLDLPIQETPSYNDTNLANWANVVSFGAVPNDTSVDSTAAIQAAIDSGKSTVYLPWGKYYISSTLHLRGQVVRLLCLGCGLKPFGTTSFPDGTAAVRVENNSLGATFIDGLLPILSPTGANFGNPTIEDASSGVLTIQNSENVEYLNDAGAGPVFMESVAFGPFSFTNQTAWIRHLDPEIGPSITHVTVTGGKVWVLGLKTENRDPNTTSGPGSTIVDASGGASVEVIGADIYEHRLTSTPALFINNSCQMSIEGAMTGSGSSSDADLWIQETRNGVTDTLYRSGYTSGPNAYSRATGSSVPLYIGW